MSFPSAPGAGILAIPAALVTLMAGAVSGLFPNLGACGNAKPSGRRPAGCAGSPTWWRPASAAVAACGLAAAPAHRHQTAA